jgi:hypothetical protein
MAFMNLRALAPITALASLALAGVAQAQMKIDSVGIEVWLPENDDPASYRQSNEIERIDYFNFAHCQCAKENKDFGTFQVRLSLDDQDAVFISDQATLSVGKDCANNENTSLRDCEVIEDILDVDQVLRRTRDVPIAANVFMYPNDGNCAQQESTSGVFLTFSEDDSATVDEYDSESYDFDTRRPPLPENIKASPGENAVNIRWDEPESRQGEVAYYQVLCARADGEPAFSSRKGNPEYDTPAGLCDSTAAVDFFSDVEDEPDPGDEPDAGSPQDAGPPQDAGLPQDAGSPPDAGPVPDAGTSTDPTRPEWMTRLDERYLCGTRSATATSIRIDGLENGMPYRVALLAVDDARNVVAKDLGVVTPQAVTDFWEDYHDQGGSADGGICLVSSTFGDGSGMTQALRDFRDRTLAASAAGRMLIEAYYAYVAPLGVHAEDSVAIRVAAVAILAPLAGLAAFWEYTSLPVKLLVLVSLLLLRRARLRRRSAVRARVAPGIGGLRPGLRPALAAAAVLAVCARAAPAAAQGDPYWDDFGTEVYVEPAEVAVAYWNVGIKVGPYTPDIDSEFMTSPGPYERMYGGAAIMGLLDVERFFLFPLGQVGVFGTAGFAQKTANAFASCPADEPDCMPETRADGDQTSFRLMPLALGAVYRFTMFDDQWHVPVVPYARAGLSYYLWWITAPDGTLSEIDGDRALGASLGWQGSLGLAVRAERLDAQSARNLRNDLGIDHAGFYGEVMYADVGGFGAEGKLRVGALTWFGGLNFEF